MKFLPIVERELRVAARRAGTYWTRMGVAAVAVVFVFFIAGTMGRQVSSANLGTSIFATLSVIAFILCTLVGIVNTADCISEEKREGTLGLLFLTDLRGIDVVLGKLAATSMSSFYSLMGIVPILAIPMLLGGTEWTKFGAMVLVLLNTMFLSLALGMKVSCHGRNERANGVLTGLAMLMLTLGIPAIGMLIYYWLGLKGVEPPAVFTWPSPVYTVSLVFESALSKTWTTDFWGSLIVQHVVAWAAILLSARSLPNSWQDRAETVAQVKRRFTWKQRAYGKDEVRRAYRERLMSINPYFWLVARDRLKPSYTWLWVAVVFAGWMYILFSWTDRYTKEPLAWMTMHTLHWSIRLWLVSEATARLAQDRQSGALELILSTSISVEDILKGHYLALRRQFMGPVIFILAFDVYLLSALRDDGDTMAIWMISMAIFVMDIFAIGTLGMWAGLKARKAALASGGVATKILILPGFVMMCIMMLSVFGSGRMDSDSMFVVWFVINLVNALAFGLSAKSNLLSRFRQVAAGEKK